MTYQVVNKLSLTLALFNLSINMGEAFGPLIGGYFTNYYSFDHSCFVVSFILQLFSLTFFFYNIKIIKSQMFVKTEEDKHNHSLEIPLIEKEKEESYKKHESELSEFVTKYRPNVYSYKSKKSIESINN